MKHCLFTILVVTLASFVNAQDQGVVAQRKGLTAEQQEAFLDRRMRPDMTGNFDNFASLLYAMDDIAIHTESQQVAETRLRSPFPDFYRPTRAEFFDSIARQTRSSVSYDTTQDFWVFAEPAMELPYQITLAEGWSMEDRGSYVFYGPPSAPVGMDVYLMGRYSATNEPGELFHRVQQDLALRFLKRLSPETTVDRMQKVGIGESEALYFELPKTPIGATWRQWVVVENGFGIVIVSAIKPEDEGAVLPAVQEMVATFRLVDPTTQPDAPANQD